MHIYPPEIERERKKISEKEPWFEGMINSRVHKWGTAESLISHMDLHGIKSSLVTGFAFQDQGLCRLMNDYVLDSARIQGQDNSPRCCLSLCKRCHGGDSSLCATWSRRARGALPRWAEPGYIRSRADMAHGRDMHGNRDVYTLPHSRTGRPPIYRQG